MVNTLILNIYWNPSKELVSWPLPFLGRPLLWYGFFFALGFFLAYVLFKYLLQAEGYDKKEAKRIAEKTSLFVGIGMIAGARLFEMLLYQSPRVYLNDPLELVRFWEGGLASHGAVVGILVALGLLKKRLKGLFSWKRLVDLLVIPALVAGTCIRVGNFFNQEILGTPSTLPWAVFFANPADGSIAMARHPVQLYEAVFYLLLALLFFWKKRYWLGQEGKVAGMFFMSCFGFRFLIEFIKVKQSALLFSFPLDMGQLLSIPLIGLGLVLIQQSKRPIGVERN
jgi:phosphatidylglycerol:prolipoprotein diacylglycerol transferase